MAANPSPIVHFHNQIERLLNNVFGSVSVTVIRMVLQRDRFRSAQHSQNAQLWAIETLTCV